MQVRNRGDLTDKQWEKIKPLLPPQKPKTGRPNSDHRAPREAALFAVRRPHKWYFMDFENRRTLARSSRSL